MKAPDVDSSIIKAQLDKPSTAIAVANMENRFMLSLPDPNLSNSAVNFINLTHYCPVNFFQDKKEGLSSQRFWQTGSCPDTNLPEVTSSP